MAKWDLSKLPEGRKPLPDEWFRERAQMQERIEELEADLRKMALDVIAADGQSQEAYQAQLESEAKLAKAVTRLQHIAANKTTDELTVIEWDTHDTFTILDACISEARITIAEITGGKDD